MMEKNIHRYYLRINGTLIDLDQIPGLKDMDNFLNLSIFTSVFKDEYDLIDALDALGFTIEQDLEDEYGIFNTVEIVKRIGNKKTGYSVKPITQEILYKNAYRFLSPSRIKEFMRTNRHNEEAMAMLLKEYYYATQKLISIIRDKIAKLELDSASSQVESRPEIRSEINLRTNSLNNFCAQEELICDILNMLPYPKEMEYIEALNHFVDREIYYYNKGKITPNNRGLVRLASRISKVTEVIHDLEVPHMSNRNDEKRKQILQALKGIMASSPKPIEYEPALIEEEYDDTLDPDEYMFLEPSDYDDLLSKAQSKEELDAIEDSIENLLERQGKFK